MRYSKLTNKNVRSQIFLKKTLFTLEKKTTIESYSKYRVVAIVFSMIPNGYIIQGIARPGAYDLRSLGADPDHIWR